MRIRNLFNLGVLALCLVLLAGCGSSDKPANTAIGTQARPLKIGVTAGPHAAVIDKVKEVAEKDGLYIQVVEFTDFVTPNVALQQGDLDANSFQHAPYLANFNKDQKEPLADIGQTILLPIAMYSDRYRDTDSLPNGAQVAIPNDPSNGGRALLLLQEKGLLKLRDGGTVTSSLADIVENPKNLRFLELDAAQIPRSLHDTDLAVINTNYALEVGLNPSRDALAVESTDSPYTNIIAVRGNEKDRPEWQQLLRAFHSDAVRQFVLEKFNGSILPAW